MWEWVVSAWYILLASVIWLGIIVIAVAAMVLLRFLKEAVASIFD